MPDTPLEQNLYYDRKAGKLVLTKDMDEELKQLIRGGRKVEAVKRVHVWTRSGLKVSKDYVDALAQSL
jgi:ribosomal protein L7/L12